MLSIGTTCLGQECPTCDCGIDGFAYSCVSWLFVLGRPFTPAWPTPGRVGPAIATTSGARDGCPAPRASDSLRLGRAAADDPETLEFSVTQSVTNPGKSRRWPEPGPCWSRPSWRPCRVRLRLGLGPGRIRSSPEQRHGTHPYCRCSGRRNLVGPSRDSTWRSADPGRRPDRRTAPPPRRGRTAAPVRSCGCRSATARPAGWFR